MLLWSAEGKPDVEIVEPLGVTPLTVVTTDTAAVSNLEADCGCVETRTTQETRCQARSLLGGISVQRCPRRAGSWTLQLLEDKLVELKVIETPISYETVRETLKKTHLTLGKKYSGASRR